MADHPARHVMHRIRRGRVASKRNSHIGVPLDWLDWSHWWTDALRDEYPVYLHVQGRKDHPENDAYSMGECVYRVYPRSRDGETVRLAQEDGELWWLFDSRPAA
jgi:hypothetical protein